MAHIKITDLTDIGTPDPLDVLEIVDVSTNTSKKVLFSELGGGGAVDSVNGQTGDVVLDIPTNTSDLINDGEDGVHPYITLLDLPSNLILYPTTVASDISGYVKLVTDIHDPEYNEPAVDVSTGSITTTNQLISSLITVPDLISGNPGVFNISTVGNIRRTAGSGTAEFYFNVYKRDSLGTETLIGVSNPTLPVNNGVYAEFSATAIWDDGVFTATDRIVLKFYGSRIAGGSNPTYEFQFGGLTPVRTLVPIPLSVVPITTTPTLQEVTDAGNVIISDDNLNKIVIDKVTQAVRFYGKSLITDPFVLLTEYTQYGLYIDQMYNFGVNKIKLEAGEGLVLDDNYGNMIVISAYSATKNGVEFATLSDIPTVANATETGAGIAEIATTAEVATGTDDTTIVTPLKLKQSLSEVTINSLSNGLAYFLPISGSSSFSSLLRNAVPVLSGHSAVFEAVSNLLFSTSATAGTLAFQRAATIYYSLSLVSFLNYNRKFKINSNITDTRFFCGISNMYSTSNPTNVAPDTQINTIGVCKMASSQNLQVLYNDATGLATLIDLGVNFPANNVVDYWYSLNIRKENNSADITVTVTRTDISGASISTSAVISSDYNNVNFHYPAMWICNNATASIASYKDFGCISEFNQLF